MRKAGCCALLWAGAGCGAGLITVEDHGLAKLQGTGPLLVRQTCRSSRVAQSKEIHLFLGSSQLTRQHDGYTKRRKVLFIPPTAT